MHRLTPPEDPTDAPTVDATGWLNMPAVRYPNAYVWFVFVSSMDIMLTWAILRRGGTEVNPVARVVIDSWGLVGAICFKFALMVLVILLCEFVGRRRNEVGTRLAWIAVAISSFPVAYSLVLLYIDKYF